MKRTFLQIIFLFLAVVGYAQNDIHFTVLKSETKGLSEDVVDALDLKLHQIFNRNSAAAADVYNVFAVTPSLSLDNVLSSEGLVRNVSLAQGELVLIAKNVIDGAEYYSVTIPIEGEAIGDKEKAMKSMVKNIKVTDPAFTRFIRTARKKIADYYASNCALILQKAQALYNQNRCDEAINYLSAATANIPCYDQAFALQQEILQQHSPKGPDTVYVDKVVERVVEKPVIVERPQPVPIPKAPECDITVSKNDLDFKIVRCFGTPQQKRITIVTEYVNKNSNMDKGGIAFNVAIDDNGNDVSNQNLSVSDNGSSYDWVSMPTRINKKQNFYITNYDHAMPVLSYLKLKIRDAIVEIRNLKVEW